MKKIFFLLILTVSLVLSMKYGSISRAYYGDGEYINIYGWYDNNNLSCKNPDSCNQYHLQGNHCNPDQGSCNVSGGPVLIQWVCNGKPSDRVCGGGVASATKIGKTANGQIKVDSNGVTCGKTVQLDVYDKDPETNSGWDSSANTIDYIVWYSGDCPLPTATPTPAPGCNADCTGNPNICTQATDGCTVCDSSTNRCVLPPTTTPTTSGTGPGGGTGGAPTVTPAPGCNVSCDGQPSDFCRQAGDGCTICDLTSKKCVPPNTQPPTTTGTGPTTTGTGTGPSGTGTGTQPSPTPAFNPAACACDGIESTSIFPGQPVEVTSYGKVSGADINNAKIESMQFLLYEGQNNTAAVLQSQTIPATVAESSSSKVRYVSKWNVVIPSTVKAGATYRIQSKLKCVKKTTAYSGESSAVLGESTSLGFLDKILSFFKNLFNRQVQNNSRTNIQPTPSVTIDIPQDVQEVTDGNKTLQLKTIKPAMTETDKCSIIRFQFSQ